MGTLTKLYDELLKECGNPLEYLGIDKIEEFPVRNCSEEIRKLVFSNEDFQSRLRSKGIVSNAFDDIDIPEYRRFLNKVLPGHAMQITNWLGLNPRQNTISISRDSAIKLLFALKVADIKEANSFILRVCGDEAYVLYARDYKDLIYKFCLQNSLGMGRAIQLIDDHRYIEMNQFELLKSIMADLGETFGKPEEAETVIANIKWDKFYQNEVKGGKEAIHRFCEERRKHGNTEPTERLIERYMSNYDSLRDIIYELFGEEKREEAKEKIIKIDWGEVHKYEGKKGRDVIVDLCNKLDYCKRIENFATLKYMKNCKVFTDVIFELAEEYGAMNEAKAFISAIDWFDFYKNEGKRGISKIHEFCRQNGIDEDARDEAVEKYRKKLESKNKGTLVFNNESGIIHTEEDLREYLEQNKHLFGMYRRTAYERFRYYYEQIVNPITEKIDFGCGHPDKLYEDMSFESFYDHLVSVGDAERLPGSEEWKARIEHNAIHQALSVMQRIIKANSVIDDTRLKEIKNNKEQVMRRYFVWVFMYSWGDIIDDAQKPIDALNDELVMCGMPRLDSRNPFDFIIMNAMYHERRIRHLEWRIEKLEAKKERSEEECQKLNNSKKVLKKLSKLDFFAIDEIKKVVKDIYSIEL